MTSGLRLILISNLLTILVTAVAVLVALHLNPSLVETTGDVVTIEQEQHRSLQNEGDCCDCDTGEYIPPPTIPDFCFSSVTTVELESGEKVPMADLRLGDRVLVSMNNKYEPIYSFGHFATKAQAEFVQIRTTASTDTPLEMTPNHLLFVEKKEGAQQEVIPASSVKVGDKVLTGGGTANVFVTSIQTITRTDGAFAPFTPSGTIVTNGIQSSCFATIQDDTAKITLGMSGTALPLNYHQLGVMFEAPHRLYCHLTRIKCTEETYNTEGMSVWVEKPLHGLEWILEQDNTLLSGLVFWLAFVLLAAINLVEVMVMHWTAVAVLFVAAAMVAQNQAQGKKEKKFWTIRMSNGKSTKVE